MMISCLTLSMVPWPTMKVCPPKRTAHNLASHPVCDSVRQLPVIAKDWDLPITEKALKDRLKAEFLKHAHIKDTRVIDMKVILVSIPKHDSNNGGM